MVQEIIRKRGLRVILEIGAFLGGSIRNWLECSDDVIVVALDPWPDSWDVESVARAMGKSQSVIEQLAAPEGMYQTFLANLWDERDRVIPVREYSPQYLYDLQTIGFQPDLIYLDSDKTGAEVQICSQLFPGAIMTGDDWQWMDELGEYPIRNPVREFSRQPDRHLRVENATWVIDDRPPSVRFRLRRFRRSLRKRWKQRRDQAA